MTPLTHHNVRFFIAVMFSIWTTSTTTSATTTTTTYIPLNREFNKNNDLYSATPNEIVPIQPILVYPKKTRTYQGRNLLRDNDIIYVKLLQRKGYRPKKYQLAEIGTKEVQSKDIFYVKAKVNGQFSTNRLKVYRMPEFYAINIYNRNDVKH